ncbi:MAG: hypothetical protein ACPG5T_06205 [Endozoicomonas sp.]
MFYACGAYVLHHELRTKALKGVGLEKAKSFSVLRRSFTSLCCLSRGNLSVQVSVEDSASG